MTTASRRPAPFLCYALGIGVLGWSALLALWRTSWEMPSPSDVLLFVLLSACLKRLGFQVTKDVTHSLVGVVDLAALFIFGPAGGTLVAAISGGLCQIMRVSRTTRTLGHPFIQGLFYFLWGGGLNATRMIVAGQVYAALRGPVPLREVSWQVLPAVFGASLTWFVLDHLGWTGAEWTLHGRERALAFLRRILPYSLMVELIPLPFSVLMSTAYLASTPPLFLFMVLVMLSAGWLLRKLMISLAEERRHVRDLSAIDKLSQALLRDHLNMDERYALIHQHCALVADASDFVLQVASSPGKGITTLVPTAGGQMERVPTERVGQSVWQRMETRPEPVLVHDFQSDAAPFQPLRTGQPVRSGVYVPLLMEQHLLGVLAVQSPDAYAFTEQDRDALLRLASQAALGLHTARLYQQEQERSSQLMAIAEVSRKVAAILDLDVLCRDTVQLVKETFGYYHVSLFTVDAARRQITFQAGSSPLIQQRGTRVLWEQGIIGHVAASGHTLLVNDVLADDRFLADAGLTETRAELAVPLKVENRTLGVLDVQSNRPGAFGEEDVFLLQTLADQIAIAIEDKQLYRRQQELGWVATALLQVAEAVAQSSTPDEILESVVRLTPMLTGVQHCLIFLWSDEEQAFTAVKTTGLPQEHARLLEAESFPQGTLPLLDQVRMEGQVVRCAPDEFLAFLPPPLFDSSHYGQITALPLRSKGEVLGVMVTDDQTDDEALAQHRQTMLTGIANQAAMALENARLYVAQREETWVSTALLQVANMISTNTDLDQTITTVVRLTPLLVGLKWCAILLWDDERQAFFGATAHGLPQAALASYAGQYYSPDQAPLLRRLLHSAQPLVVLDTEAEELAIGPTARLFGSDSVTALPLRTRYRLLGALLAGHTERGKALTGQRLSILLGIANQAALAIEASQFYQQTLHQERLQREMELAGEIQASFMPECCPEVEGWQFAVEWRAARGVGGDYYDFIPLDENRVGLVIADVSDKGVGAALYMALSRTVMRIVAQETPDPAEALRRANDILLQDSRAGMFVTLFYAVLEKDSGTFTYARAGHNPPLLVRAADGSMTPLMPPGIVLGVLEEAHFEQETTQLQPGDVVVMYTDGVVEAIDERNQEFGEKRLRALLSQAAHHTANSLVNLISAGVRVFTGERMQFDDLTLMVIKRE
jgi:sigma-B regulation protein RsbU (phosphoserine phosphatase)